MSCTWTDPRAAAKVAIDLARREQFALVGIAPAVVSEHAEHVRAWIARGEHGEMHYLENHLDVRLDPEMLLEGARSIICVADAYPPEDFPQDPSGEDSEPRGRIARYAWGNDYHKTIKKRLFRVADGLRERFAEHQFKCTTDTAPLLEREHAARAGLGWIGKHTLLIHPRFGSYTLLGAIVTTLELETSEQAGYPEPGVWPTDHCGTCTRCIDACPTDCITPREVDATRCISYLTLEHRSEIDPSLHEAMGDWIAGCDICQEVCPYNQEGYREPLPIVERYEPRAPAPSLGLLDVLNWTAEDREAAFQGSALKRVKLDMLNRNALIAAGNHLCKNEDAALRARVGELAEDEAQSPLVRETARRVLDRIG